MKLLIAGDVLPHPCNQDAFESGDARRLMDAPLRELFGKAALRVCNLEGPLTDRGCAIQKSGPCIKASVNAVKGLKAMGFDCVSLANNHCMDYGLPGYRDTAAALASAGIDSVGAGNNVQLARQPRVFERGGKRIGLYACAEYEFTMATQTRAGANPFDALFVLDDIAQLKAQTDYVIVLYHGGKEYYRYPAPYLQRRCRRMVEKGADLVLCQHSHCIGCHEKWGSGEILYGQGNFLFHRGDDEFKHSGLLAQVSFQDERWSVEYLPVVKGETGVLLADREEGGQILRDFEARSGQILDDAFVQSHYQQFADNCLNEYYKLSLGKLAFFAKVFFKLGKKSVYRDNIAGQEGLDLLNALRCEAHQDLFAQGIVDSRRRELDIGFADDGD